MGAANAESFVDEAYRTFDEDVADALVGKEGYLVEQVSAKSTVQLFTSGIPLGVIYQRLQGSHQVTVRLLGKGGTVKVVAGGAINSPGYVKGASGGKVVAASSADLAVGVKISPAAAAANGDIIEIIDRVHAMP